MALFQKSVLKKYLSELDELSITTAYSKFQSIFNSPGKQRNIINSKEEQYQEGFLRELFVLVLGYTLNPEENFNLITEKKNEKDSKKADGAILCSLGVIAVIELKPTKIIDLGSIESQAFGYKNNHKGCKYVVTSNYRKLRFYIDNAVDFEEFDLFNLNLEDFRVLWMCLSASYLLKDIPFQIKQASNTEEEKITKKLYTDYAEFRKGLFRNIYEQNEGFDKMLLFEKTQKLLDRFLFLFFAEDRGLVSPNWTRKILKDWENLKDYYDTYIPLYERFCKNFDYLNSGYNGMDGEVFAYNGGLFAHDEILSTLVIDDDLLFEGASKLSNYDFESEVDVNILGHIFEHSLNEIDELQASLIVDTTPDNSQKITKRKKDGVFYTPKYITKYIVERSIGELCRNQKLFLEIFEEDYELIPASQKIKRKRLNQKLTDYKVWLLELKILDPACGSGAFLNQALDFLIFEHRKIDELRARLLGGSIILSDVENSILENNLYGVDLNEEAVEIAKLSLWLRTARKGRKLSVLSNNIKCGNSLISDGNIGGNKAFNWQEQFSYVFSNGGFDVIIGNPPYGIFIDEKESAFFASNFPLTRYKINLYILFIERMFQIFHHQPIISFIIPKSLLFNTFYDAMRKHLIENSHIREILTISDKVFNDAEVGGSLIITFILNNTSETELTKFVSLKSFFDSDWKTQYVNQDNYLKVPKYEISFSDNSLADIKSILLSQSKLREFFISKNGLNPGNIKEKLISDQKANHNYKKIIWGKNIFKFRINWSGSFINYDPSVEYTTADIKSKEGMNSQTTVDFALRSKDIFEIDKLVIRKTGDRLITSVDLDHFYFDTLVHGIYSKNGNTDELKALSVLLNSHVATFIYRLLHDIKGKNFAKISLDNLKDFPTPSPDDLLKSNLVEYYNKYIFHIDEIEYLKEGFYQFVISESGISTPNFKLYNWNTLSFKDFIFEIEKNGKKLSLDDKANWFEFYTKKDKEMNRIVQSLNRLDLVVDDCVLKLYRIDQDGKTAIGNILNQKFI